jgi:hypothetical protein
MLVFGSADAATAPIPSTAAAAQVVRNVVLKGMFIWFSSRFDFAKPSRPMGAIPPAAAVQLLLHHRISVIPGATPESLSGICFYFK